MTKLDHNNADRATRSPRQDALLEEEQEEQEREDEEEREQMEREQEQYEDEQEGLEEEEQEMEYDRAFPSFLTERVETAAR